MRLIDADALLDKTVKKNGAWKSITNSEGKNLEEIVSDIPTEDAIPWNIMKDWLIAYKKSIEREANLLERMIEVTDKKLKGES